MRNAEIEKHNVELLGHLNSAEKLAFDMGIRVSADRDPAHDWITLTMRIDGLLWRQARSRNDVITVTLLRMGDELRKIT